MAPGPGRRCRETWRTACLRDAVALQLARRGFDGLRGTALWLVAELAADFTRALGYQLAQVAVPSPYTDASLLPLVRRLQRHTLLTSPAEWAHMATIFSRSTPPTRSRCKAPSTCRSCSSMVRVEFGSRPPSWPQTEVNILIYSVTSH